jgi:AcrR family transcriptional regulator
MAQEPKKTRRTQEERTAAMRERLLNATVECLYELGYAKTTTTAIVERAGVSRGAQLHHFPTKADLVASAVEFVMERRNEEFREAFSKLEPGDDMVDQVIETLWNIFSGPTFYAWLELLVAARTDDELNKTVGAIAERFLVSVDDTFRTIFQLPKEEARGLAIAPRFTFLLLEGLALERIRRESPKTEAKILRALKALAPAVVDAARG